MRFVGWPNPQCFDVKFTPMTKEILKNTWHKIRSLREIAEVLHVENPRLSHQPLENQMMVLATD